MLHCLFHAIAAKLFEDRLGQYDCHHRLADDASSRNYAHVTALIAALVNVFTGCQINRGQGMSECRNWLDANAHHDWLSIGNTPLDSSCVIREMRPATVFTVSQHIVYI